MIKNKLPQWYVHPDLVFPSSLAYRQASSQATACYKQSFLLQGARVIDCTGGLGVDSAAFASKASKVVYIEQNESLCQAAAHNFNLLGLPNIEILHGNCIDLLPAMTPADMIYIDPSRRSTAGRQLLALSDYEPDILSIKEMLLQKAPKVLVKISPMADIRQSLRMLPETAEVHVLSVHNECKELLFLLERPQANPVPVEEVPINCVHINTLEKEERFTFKLGEEKATLSPLVARLTTGYLYEPNSSLLKAGAFKLPAITYGMQKLHPHTHLYHAPILQKSFPGRIFQIQKVLDFNKQTIKNLRQTIPKANIAVRNFCMEATELQKRLKIKDGGDVYLFGVKLSGQNYTLIVAFKEN